MKAQKWIFKNLKWYRFNPEKYRNNMPMNFRRKFKTKGFLGNTIVNENYVPTQNQCRPCIWYKSLKWIVQNSKEYDYNSEQYGNNISMNFYFTYETDLLLTVWKRIFDPFGTYAQSQYRSLQLSVKYILLHLIARFIKAQFWQSVYLLVLFVVLFVRYLGDLFMLQFRQTNCW